MREQGRRGESRRLHPRERDLRVRGRVQPQEGRNDATECLDLCSEGTGQDSATHSQRPDHSSRKCSLYRSADVAGK